MSRAKALVLAATSLFMLAGPAPASAAPKPPPNFDVVGYFGDPGDCQWAGSVGRASNRWMNFDCDRARGPFRGMWQLTVRRYGGSMYPGPMGPPHRPGSPPHGPWPR
jgi:hypothetical protein